MKKIIALLFVACPLILSGCSRAESANAETQQTSQIVIDNDERITEDNIRIVAGTVAAMQFLDFLEVDNVVGIVSTDRNIPERYMDVQRIGMSMGPNTEIVLSLEPDIYVGESMLQYVVEEILQTVPDVKRLYLTSGSYQSILDNVNAISEALGIEKRGEELEVIMNNNIQQALEIAGNAEPPVVAILFGTPNDFQIAGNNSFAGDILRLVGGINIANITDSDLTYVNMDREKLAYIDPDIILRLSHGSKEMMAEASAAFDMAYEEDFWQGLQAVRNGRVYDLDPELFSVTVTMESLDAPIEMARILYGDNND